MQIMVDKTIILLSELVWRYQREPLAVSIKSMSSKMSIRFNKVIQPWPSKVVFQKLELWHKPMIWKRISKRKSNRSIVYQIYQIKKVDQIQICNTILTGLHWKIIDKITKIRFEFKKTDIWFKALHTTQEMVNLIFNWHQISKGSNFIKVNLKVKVCSHQIQTQILVISQKTNQFWDLNSLLPINLTNHP